MKIILKIPYLAKLKKIKIIINELINIYFLINYYKILFYFLKWNLN
jgi:hypothetical protein